GYGYLARSRIKPRTAPVTPAQLTATPDAIAQPKNLSLKGLTIRQQPTSRSVRRTSRLPLHWPRCFVAESARRPLMQRSTQLAPRSVVDPSNGVLTIESREPAT